MQLILSVISNSVGCSGNHSSVLLTAGWTGLPSIRIMHKKPIVEGDSWTTHEHSFLRHTHRKFSNMMPVFVLWDLYCYALHCLRQITSISKIGKFSSKTKVWKGCKLVTVWSKACRPSQIAIWPEVTKGFCMHHLSYLYYNAFLPIVSSWMVIPATVEWE